MKADLKPAMNLLCIWSFRPWQLPAGCLAGNGFTYFIRRVVARSVHVPEPAGAAKTAETMGLSMDAAPGDPSGKPLAWNILERCVPDAAGV